MRGRTRRTERIAVLIHEELGFLLEHEVKDPRVGFVTVTAVEVTPDLQAARIFVSVLGDAEQKQRSLEGLTAAQNFLRYQLAQRLGLRHTPALAFQLDPTQDYQERIEELLRRARWKP